jgi:hypothetical protein
MCTAENLALAVAESQRMNVFIMLYINRQQCLNTVWNFNFSEVDNDTLEVLSDLCF